MDIIHGQRRSELDVGAMINFDSIGRGARRLRARLIPFALPPLIPAIASVADGIEDKPLLLLAFPLFLRVGMPWSSRINRYI